MADTTRIFRTVSGSEIHAVFGNIKFADIQMIKYATTRQKVPIYTMGDPNPRAIARGARSTSGALIFSHISNTGLVEEMRKSGSKVFLSNDELANYDESFHDRKPPSEALKRALKASGSLAHVGTVSSSGLQALPADGSNVFDPFAVGESINSYDNFGKAVSAFLADQLPPFDITLVGIPETAGNEIDNQAFQPQSLILRGVEFVSESSGTSIEDLVIEKQMSFIARGLSPWKETKY